MRIVTHSSRMAVQLRDRLQQRELQTALMRCRE
jgi:hypothetical protein